MIADACRHSRGLLVEAQMDAAEVVVHEVQRDGGGQAIQRVLDKTGNLKAAQAVAGHATVGTTGDIYTDWSIGQTEQTMRDVLA